MRKKICYVKHFLVLFIMMALIVTGCSSKEKNPNSEGTNSGNNTGTGTNEQVEKLEDNITSNAAITEKGELVVFAKNNNKVPVKMEIEVEFYDANGTIVGSDDEELMSVGANSEVAVRMWSTPETFDNYKIYVDVEKTTVKSYHDQLEIVHNNTKEAIAVQAKNNSQDEIQFIGVSVVYYQGEKVVGFADGLESDIKAGRAANFNLHFPHNKNYREITFDSYKVFITDAYSYNW